jgi:hypothetical protein
METPATTDWLSSNHLRNLRPRGEFGNENANNDGGSANESV